MLAGQHPCRPSLGASKLQESGHMRPFRTTTTINMIIRTVLRVQAPKIAGRRSFQIASRPMKATRRYSTANASPMAASTPQSQASMLATITTDLDKIAPRFEIQPDQVQIIKTPAEFYETLKVGYAIYMSLFIPFCLTTCLRSFLDRFHTSPLSSTSCI